MNKKENSKSRSEKKNTSNKVQKRNTGLMKIISDEQLKPMFVDLIGEVASQNSDMKRVTQIYDRMFDVIDASTKYTKREKHMMTKELGSYLIYSVVMKTMACIGNQIFGPFDDKTGSAVDNAASSNTNAVGGIGKGVPKKK